MSSGSHYSQDARLIGITTPLGTDVLLLRSMLARERLSALFEFELDLLSEDDQIAATGLLGQPATVRLEMRDQTQRFFNGIVSRFSHVGFEGRLARYQATLVPWPWLLTRTSDCRIFQEMRAPDIIEQVFRDAGFTDFDDRLSADYRTWEYCVQYRETHFNFVSRLMEHEGIYWYFTHEDGKHTLVMADGYASHQPIPGDAEIPYHAADLAAERDADFIFAWSLSSVIRAGAFVHDAFDFKKPSAELRTSSALTRAHARADFEIYDYPGEYVATGEGDRYASLRMEELQADHEIVTGEGYARGLAVGHFFTLTDYPRVDQNREYLLISAQHELRTDLYQSQDGAGDEILYRASFTALDAHEPYRAPRVTPKPLVKGPQTAIVVGPPGEEIWTDEYGRVKVQFHWDRYGQMDENSSCWIRVSHPWAGQNWGAVSIPRIGQEVIVSFLEADADRPIITGRVYNAEQMPPFDLPAGKVVSGIKSNTHKGKGYNEMTMDDTAGKEKITIHAQFDMNTTVEHDRTATINTGNDTLTVVTGKRDVTVKGNSSHTVQAGARAVTVTGGDYSATSTDAAARITGQTSVNLTGKSIGVFLDGKGEGVGVKGQPLVSIEGTSDVSIKGKSSVGIKGSLVDVGDDTIQIHGSSITLECGGSTIAMDASKITLSSGSGQLVLDASGATLNGALVKIN